MSHQKSEKDWMLGEAVGLADRTEKAGDIRKVRQRRIGEKSSAILMKNMLREAIAVESIRSCDKFCTTAVVCVIM